jgi:hypothetical protein
MRRKQPSTFLEDRNNELDPLLQKKINELGLRLEGTVLEKLVSTLEKECVAAGITKLKPVCYLTEEWGVPEGVPIIGIPYYLADERLKKLEEDVVEGETEDEILSYLRHEMGHVVNYAYQLYTTDEWARLFGPPSRPYVEEYQPEPFSRDFVRHIPGWYAQKHPDEDFAETFAVWLTPGSDWRTRYTGTGAERKLEYVEKVMKRLGGQEPDVTTGEVDVSVEGITYTVEEHLKRFRDPAVDVPPYFDGDLRDLFGKPSTKDPDREAASAFLKRHRRLMQKRIAHWTGVREGVIRSLIDHLAQRSDVLGIHLDRKKGEERVLVDVMAYMTTLGMNYLYKGAFHPSAGVKR